MANRILRDYTNSKKVDSLSADAERLFIRLMMQADDYGNFYSETRQIKSKCFPLKDVSVKRVEELLKELIKSGLVKLYQVDSETFLHIIEFNQSLRRMRRKFPVCADEMTDNCQTNDGQVTDNVPPETKQKRNETESETETKMNPKAAPKNAAYVIEDFFSIDDLILKYSTDDHWVGEAAYTLSCEILKVRDLLEKFRRFLGTQKILQKKESDFRSHFMNWARKQNEKTHGKNITDRPRLGTTAATGFGKL